MKLLKITGIAATAALISFGASAQNSTQVGTLACDVSAGLGLFVVEKQKLTCTFTEGQSGRVDQYTGSIDQFGVALGEVSKGHLLWGVVSVTAGVPKGALAGKYAGVGANASLGVGAGANVLVGASDSQFSLQPLSVEGQVGVNIAGGITTVTLVAKD